MNLDKNVRVELDDELPDRLVDQRLTRRSRRGSLLTEVIVTPSCIHGLSQPLNRKVLLAGEPMLRCSEPESYGDLARPPDKRLQGDLAPQELNAVKE